MDETLFPTREQIAQDFRENAPGLTEVTVYQINPDNGATTATAEEVTALKRVHSKSAMSIGDGEIPDERCRFWLVAEDMEFTPKRRDKIEDADGITWTLDSADLVAFGALAVCETSRARSS